MDRHLPVLIEETVRLLVIGPGDAVIDATLGDAGHSEALLEANSPNGQLLGIDADIEAILRAKRFLYRFEGRVSFAHSNFSELAHAIAEARFPSANAILFDLGWSSPQFQDRGRGFSFESNEPLDMRYGPSAKHTAAELLNDSSPAELASILRRYGEDPLGEQIVAGIIAARKQKPFEKTSELVEIILQVYREKLRSAKEVPWIGGIHPATRTFQALRIVVNDELGVLKAALPQAVAALKPGGRLAVISFHSLEDRIVKQFFKLEQSLKEVTPRPVMATAQELAKNPRARSAKLRVAEKIK